jgi:hypothetical protein
VLVNRTLTRRELIALSVALGLGVSLAADADVPPEPDAGSDASDTLDVELDLDFGDPWALDGVTELPDGDLTIRGTVTLLATTVDVGVASIAPRLGGVDVEKAPADLADSLSKALSGVAARQLEAQAAKVTAAVKAKIQASDRPKWKAVKDQPNLAVVVGGAITLAAVAGAASSSSGMPVGAAVAAVGQSLQLVLQVSLAER